MKVSEKDLAKIIVDYFENQGYETYKEVTERGGKPRADIIAVKDNQYVVIECKTTLNLKLLEQSYYWKPRSHKTFISIPTSRGTRSKSFGYTMCRDYGIGILEVNMKSKEVIERSPSSITTEPDLPRLYEEQKDSIAGVSSGDYITPFKLTCRRLVNYIKENKESPLNKALESIEHHYSNNGSAKNAIHKMINIGAIPELEVFRSNKKVFIRMKKED
jgi:hypothetical protein